MRILSKNPLQSPYAKQGGAVMLVGLMLLLGISFLAVSSVRQAALESRLVGNSIEQQNLAAAAEMGLRDGESKLMRPIKPPDPKADCANVGNKLCLLTLKDDKYSYMPRFDDGGDYPAYSPTNDTEGNPGVDVEWYATLAPSGGTEAEAENPEYGSMLTGNATFRYEVNSRSTNDSTSNERYERSTVAKLFDPGS
ncbi:Type IV fimbrial biogenesis protein PilX [gamma proteobacterium HdN1]|nr:Type IV fimbrial biogenesis protein PilX [gamma proteobacterium HdN1]